jgi:hypothetical protein
MNFLISLKKFYFLTIRSKNVSNLFHNLKNVKESRKKFENRSILHKFAQFYPHFINLNHVLKKVGRRSSDDLF